MNKRKISIIINVLIVLFETFALVKSYNFDHRIMFEYYTVDSNLLALFSSLFYLICIIGEKKVNKFVKLFKYVTTVGLTITFVVVLVILLPMVGFNFNYLFFQGAMPYHHLICPILSFITFIYYDDLGKYYKKDSYYPLGVTLIYSFTLIVLNILRKIDGPYPFLKVYNQTFIVSVLWFILIIGMGYLISIIVLKFRNQPQVHFKK